MVDVLGLSSDWTQQKFRGTEWLKTFAMDIVIINNHDIYIVKCTSLKAYSIYVVAFYKLTKFIAENSFVVQNSQFTKKKLKTDLEFHQSNPCHVSGKS